MAKLRHSTPLAHLLRPVLHQGRSPVLGALATSVAPSSANDEGVESAKKLRSLVNLRDQTYCT